MYPPSARFGLGLACRLVGGTVTYRSNSGAPQRSAVKRTAISLFSLQPFTVGVRAPFLVRFVWHNNLLAFREALERRVLS
jgi:hypothetical protein